MTAVHAPEVLHFRDGFHTRTRVKAKVACIPQLDAAVERGLGDGE